MIQLVRRHLAVFLAALLGTVVGSVGPGVARAAYDAVNADKVDGFHAVGPGASANNRAGKLVASNSNGRAPDAERLGGYPHSKLRSLPLPIQGVALSDQADFDNLGVALYDGAQSTLSISFIVPPDHRKVDPLLIDLVFADDELNPCDLFVDADGATGLNAGVFANGYWHALPNDSSPGPIHVPVNGTTVHSQTFRWSLASSPGESVQFELSRLGGHVNDTCNAMILVVGLQLRY